MMNETCETKESCMEKMRVRIKSNLPEIIGIIVGAVAGYLYYLKVGCSSGGCMITSNPFMSIIWGSMLGYLLGGMFNKKKK